MYASKSQVTVVEPITVQGACSQLPAIKCIHHFICCILCCEFHKSVAFVLACVVRKSTIANKNLISAIKSFRNCWLNVEKAIITAEFQKDTLFNVTASPDTFCICTELIDAAS